MYKNFNGVRNNFRKVISLVLAMSIVLSVVCSVNLVNVYASDEKAYTVTSGNLLVNPDAEIGDIRGWTDPDNSWTSGNNVTPHGGNKFFWPQKNGLSNTSVYQDVYLADINNTYFHLSGWMCNYDQSPCDRATLAIEAYDGTGKSLAKYECNHQSAQWLQYKIDKPIPSGTKRLRVTLIATRFCGYNNDAYFDDLALYVDSMIPDKTPPVITLKGNPVEYVTCGGIYADAGAQAIDDRDGDISSLISVSRSVYTDIPATYSVTYSVYDKAGNAAIPVSRTVIVTPLSNSVTPSEVTYDARKLPTFTATLSTLNKLSDIKNGSVSLVAGKDYTVSGSTLSIAPGYFNYYFNKFLNQDLKLVLCFSAGDSVTLTVHPYWEQIPVINPGAVKIDKAQITDVPVTMTLYGNTLTSVNNGTSALNPVNDYSISGNTVTIKKSYITYYFSKFPNQNLNIIFKFSNGYNQVLSLYTGNSPNTEITPEVVTYKVGSKTDVTVTANMNGNFFSSINNGTSALVPRVDYTYATDTNTLYIRNSYIAYYFNKFNQDLVLTINFTGGKPVTLTIKPVL